MSSRRKTTQIVKTPNRDGAEAAREVVADQLESLARRGRTGDVDDRAGGGGGRVPRPRTVRTRGGLPWLPQRLFTAAADARSGTIALETPRVRDVPRRQEPFESKIIRKYQRRSDTIDETFMNLFVEGLATRDFEPSLRLLMGEQAPLSPSVISWLTQRAKGQYEAFDRQDLSEHTFVYVWADGIYLRTGLGTEKACLLVLIGADIEGRKHLIALREGYRESAASWGELVQDCRARGMNEPACWIADGAMGIWAAVNEHCRHSAQQRCTNHKTMNVIDKLPMSERPEYTKRLRAIWQANSESAARKLAAKMIHDLSAAGYDRAAPGASKTIWIDV